ncbi:hypothetical protein KY312_01940 [Candidatus Woesearchaeota archaeon]|nr:hypothetical protein [Candidatus Woesearchaeota archaeon]
MEFDDLRINVQRTKGALDYYNELLSSGATEIAKQRLQIVKHEIIKLTMKTEHIVKQLENQIIK